MACSAGSRSLRLANSGTSRKLHLLQVVRDPSDDDLRKWALLVYGIYRATNEARARGKIWNPLDAEEAIIQFIRTAVLGNKGCTSLLANIWKL